MTKRKEPLDIYRVWNLFFWNKCKKCGKEFCREWGWRKLVGPWAGGRYGHWEFVCIECCPTKAEANVVFTARPPRPPPPPPCPSK